MDAIVSNITSGFLNDILKAIASRDELANYQNIILPEILAAVAKYCAFKDSILERFKRQPTRTDTICKCEHDVFMTRLNEQELALKECVRLNQATTERLDNHLGEDTPNIRMNIVDSFIQEKEDEEAKKEEVEEQESEVEVESEAEEQEPEVEVESEAEEQKPEVEVDEPEVEVDEQEVEVESEAEEQEPEVEVDVEADEPEADEPEAEEEEEQEAEEEEEQEADISEEEIEVDEEVEEYTYKGKKYYVTNTTNGKIYACTVDDDIGDQVGTFNNGKPIFS
jgi:hypothetical protein